MPPSRDLFWADRSRAACFPLILFPRSVQSCRVQFPNMLVPGTTGQFHGVELARCRPVAQSVCLLVQVAPARRQR